MTLQERARNRRVVYFAHPLGDNIDENIARAERWLLWLMEREPHIAFLCPWMAYVRCFRNRFGGQVDKGHPFRERSMLDNLAIAQLGGIEGITVCGPRQTSGMRTELNTIVQDGAWVSDLTALGGGLEPPSDDELQALGYDTSEGWSPLALGRMRWEARA